MQQRTNLLVIVCLLLVTAFGAAAQTPTPSFNFQGRLADSAGKPVADGNYGMTFKLYAVASGADAPLWTSAAITSTVTNGVFSVTLNPPTSVYANASLWLETTVGTDTLSPRIQLQATPFAIRATTADSAATATTALTVPDGSITLTKLGSDVKFAPAPYVNGIQSNTQYMRLRVDIDGAATNPPAVLAAPYKEELERVTSKVTDPSGNLIYRMSPGRARAGSLVLRRKVTSDGTWFTWASSSFGTPARHDITLRLMDGKTAVGLWTNTQGWVSQYKLCKSDDGLPMEQISVEFDNRFARDVPNADVPVPYETGPQVGFTSGYASGSHYHLLIDGSSLNAVQVASDEGFGLGIIESLSGTGGVLKHPGGIQPMQLKVRQNPGATGSLWNWWAQLWDGNIQRKALRLTLTPYGGTAFSLWTSTTAWPCSYTLRLADDGAPVEEFEFAQDYPTTSR